MQNAIKPLTFDGETIPHRVGHVLVVLTCVRLGSAYRAAVQHGATGAEVPELSASYPTEAEARSAARNACSAFANGQSVTAVLNRLEEANRELSHRGTVATPVRTPIVLVERGALPRQTGPGGLIRITPPQYRVLAACLAAGTDELARGEGEASITTLRALAQFGAADLITTPDHEVIGARVTGFGWRALSAETARRAGKPSPQMVPVPVAALAAVHQSPRLQLVVA